jgi:hypothetical protein
MAKTATLPGVTPASNAELTVLAENYAAARDERMEKLKGEIDLKNRVIAKMEALEITSYHDDEANLTITLETKTKVKVKIGSGDAEDD